VWRRGYTFLILTSTYLLPLSMLSITYGLVIRKLWRRRAPGNADTARDSQQLRSKRRVSIKYGRKKTSVEFSDATKKYEDLNLIRRFAGAKTREPS